MKRFISSLLRRFSRRSLLITEEAWLNCRRKDVLDALTSPVSPLADKPYIEGGSYEWCVEDKIKLDFFFPPEKPGMRPVAVRVTGRHHGPYSQTEDKVPSRRFWEARCEEDFYTLDVCLRAGIPLLIVTPDDPVDPFSISVKLKSLLK